MLHLQCFDHYRLLGIADSATADEIELAYEAAVARTPTNWRMRVVAQLRGRTPQRFRFAYEELIDPAKRAKYDAYLVRVNSTPVFIP